MSNYERPAQKDGRDERLGDALSRLPVSQDGPRFWTELSARLAALDKPRGSSHFSQGVPVYSPSASRTVTIEPTSLEEPGRRRVRWRIPTIIVAAAALAVVAVVGTVGTGRRDRGPGVRDVKVGTQPNPTPTVRSRYPDCQGGKPGGSQPCTYPCVSLGIPSDADHCLYDPAAPTPTTSQYSNSTPPTTASNSSSPAVPPTAAN